MADQSFRWIDGRAHMRGVVEKICPNVHVTQNQWNDYWNGWFDDSPHSYSYISDYECIFGHPVFVEYNIALYTMERWQNLQAAKRRGTPVPINNLAHFTRSDTADYIIESGAFIGGDKKINEAVVDGNNINIVAELSWWSPNFTSEEGNQVRDTLGEAIQPFLREYYSDDLETLKRQFATSDAFIPNPRRYGSSYFQYGIGELCRHYQKYIGEELQYKILGTYAYKQEIMHAVLVCGRTHGVQPRFAACPTVLTPEQDANHEAVVTRDENGNWVWKPQATSTEIIRLKAHQQSYPMYRRWENVAFAFHTPINESSVQFILPDLNELYL